MPKIVESAPGIAAADGALAVTRCRRRERTLPVGMSPWRRRVAVRRWAREVRAIISHIWQARLGIFTGASREKLCAEA